MSLLCFYDSHVRTVHRNYPFFFITFFYYLVVGEKSKSKSLPHWVLDPSCTHSLTSNVDGSFPFSLIQKAIMGGHGIHERL